MATLCYTNPSMKRNAILRKGTLGPLFGGAKDVDDDVLFGTEGSFATFCGCLQGVGGARSEVRFLHSDGQ